MDQIIIVIATRNPGKTDEIRALLAGFPIDIKNLNDFGPIPEIIEDGQTFDDNAYKKSSMTARMLGLPALADDSGLCVDALDGLPGVHSARYAGPGATDADNCRKLLDALKGTTDRNAAFECVISLAVPTGAALTYTGRCEGVITETPMGSDGFGYDPLFFYPPLNKTFAQLGPEEKNRVSHRGKALAEMREEWEKVAKWIGLQMPVAEKFACKE
ncbi:MAG: XTP/dITP diphosphatase [Desulfobacteraceae bacterium]|jgi:XTP/dITP diphosphohydrolase|nr:MAG: XTP/dITP diphosphatase [Desulfobacteraceae bacterium]